MAINHLFTSPIADGTNTQLVRPSNWNAEHIGTFILSAGTQTAGSNATVIFSNSNNISFGISGNSIITASHNALTSQSTQYNAITLGGNTAGTTSFNATDNNSIFLYGGNNITLSGNGSSITISGAAAGGGQTGISGIGASNSTYTSGTVIFSGQNNITVGTSIDGASQYVRLSAPNATVFSNSNNVTFGLNASTITATATFAQTNQTANFYVSSNTTQLSSTAGIDLRSITFQGAGIASIGVSEGKVLVSVAGAGADGYNSAQFTNSTANSTQPILWAGNSNGSGNLTFGLTGSTVTGSAAAGGGGATISSYANFPAWQFVTTHAGLNITQGSYSKRPILIPLIIPAQINGINTIEFLGSRGTAGTSLNMTYGIAFYTLVNSTSLALQSSTTHAISITTSALYSGLRMYRFTGLSNYTMTAGQYVCALYFSGSNNSTAVANLGLMGAQTFTPNSGFVYEGTNSSGATSGSIQIFPFWGVFSTTTAGFPAGINKSEISGQGNSTINMQPLLILRNV